LLMAAIGAVAFGLLAKYGNFGGKSVGLVAFTLILFTNFITINVFLALFNLLPIPPFDGSHIVEGILPRGLAGAYAKFRQMGMLLVILLLVVVPQMVPGFNLVGQFVGPPMRWMMQHYLGLATWAAGI
jgi:Zn-dependent protease